MSRFSSERHRFTADDVRSLFDEHDILTKGYNMPSPMSLEVIAKTIENLKSQNFTLQHRNRLRIEEFLNATHSMTMLTDIDDTGTIQNIDIVRQFVEHDGVDFQTFSENLRVVLRSLERTLAIMGPPISRVVWHNFVGRLEYHFRSAMRSTNPDKVIGRKPDGPLSRFLQAIIPLICGDQPKGGAIIKELKRSPPIPDLPSLPRLPSIFTGRGGDKKQ